MKFTWSFLTFIVVCLSGVLSHTIVNDIDNIHLSKRSYRMIVPNPRSFTLRGKSDNYSFYKIEFTDRKLVATKCFYSYNENCKMSVSATIQLQYNARCSYGDSSIKKIEIYDSDGDNVSELINLTKVGQNRSAHRYIKFYFKNDCKFTAEYNYKDVSINEMMTHLL